MFKRFLPFFAALSLALASTGCATYKDIVYFKDIDEVQLERISSQYQAQIKKGDRLTIVVSGPDKSVTSPYNLTLGDLGLNGVGGSYNPEVTTLSYLVDVDGNIEFPILGRIHVEGMTRKQLVDYLTAEIGKDVQDPIVYVAFRNYRITILGEVRAPGTYTFDSERVNILQALGMAGDLSLTAERHGILLLREEDGLQTHYKIDMQDSHLLDSPYFYLQQNDVLIVPPSPTRVTTATAATGIWSIALSTISTTLAIITMVIGLTR